MARDYEQEVINPAKPDGPRIQAVFPAKLTLYLYKYAPVGYENLRVAKYVLQNTKRIFYGLREFNEGGWCYTGKPLEWCIREGEYAPFPDHLVFAVYMNSRMHVYECRAERVAADDQFSPCDWQSRYRGLVWKSIS